MFNTWLAICQGSIGRTQSNVFLYSYTGCRKSFFDQQLNGSNLINFDTTGTKFNCEYMYLLCNLWFVEEVAKFLMNTWLAICQGSIGRTQSNVFLYSYTGFVIFDLFNIVVKSID
jgi:hypothetical protein